MDLAFLDVDELFGFEVAEGPDQGFGGCADVLSDVFAGDGESSCGGVFGLGGRGRVFSLGGRG